MKDESKTLASFSLCERMKPDCHSSFILHPSSFAFPSLRQPVYTLLALASQKSQPTPAGFRELEIVSGESDLALPEPFASRRGSLPDRVASPSDTWRTHRVESSETPLSIPQKMPACRELSKRTVAEEMRANFGAYLLMFSRMTTFTHA